MKFLFELLAILPALAPLISPAAALPLPASYARNVRRQINVSVIGFTTLAGDAVQSFSAAIASETGGPAGAIATGGSVASATTTSSAASSTSTSGSGSSGSTSTEEDAEKILILLKDLGDALGPLVEKAGEKGLGVDAAKSILDELEGHLSDGTSDIKGLSKVTEADGSVNITAVADDAIFILQNVLTVVDALESNPITDVVLGPEGAVVDASLTGLLVALQLFVNVEPVIKDIIEGNASLKSELTDLGGAVLKLLGI